MRRTHSPQRPPAARLAARLSLLLPLVLLWGCPEENKPSPTGGQEVDMGDEGDEFVFPDANVEDMLIPDAEPMEPTSCELDADCFPGRICAEGACADAECQIDADCPAEAPVCFGPEGEEPNQRKGRCGSCAGDEDCYGESACVPFEGADPESTAGLCALSGACSGSLECAPSSRLVVRGGEGIGAASGEGERVSEVCVDRRSTDREPVCEPAFDCRAEGANMPCPEGLTCLPSGQCASASLGDGCEERAQCGFGEVCRRATSVCGPCENDVECGPAQVCASGACVEVPGACQNDSQCLGARRCVLNECVPAECEEDAFGGEHTSLESALEVDGDRVYRGMMSCSDDVFRFTLPPATSALIAVRQRDRGANLGLQVLDADGREVARSVGGAPVEAARLLESAAPRVFYARVFQEGPSSAARYDLELHYAEVGDGVCFDDPFELNGGDDTLEQARLIRASANLSFPEVVKGQVCPGDVDVMCFAMVRNERLTVKGRVELGDALVTGVLYNPDGDAVQGDDGPVEGQWAPDLNPIEIDYVAEESGLYCLSLTSDVADSRRLGQGRYALELNAVSPQLASLCGAAERLTLEQGRAGALSNLEGTDALRATCAPDSDAPEAAFNVDVTSPSLLVARVSGLPTGTLGDPVISLRERCDQATSELACSARTFDVSNPFITPPNPAVLRAPITPPVDPVTGEGVGRYTLIVDGVSAGERPELQLDVELRPLSPPPVNDTCDRVEALSFEGGVAVVEASLDQAEHSAETCGDAGPDVFYSFTLEQRSDVTLQAASKPSEFPVVVAVSERCGGQVLSCGFGTQLTLEPGEYFVTLSGVDAQARGLTELQVSVTPVPANPSNDTCEGAISLDGLSVDGLSGTLNGDTRGAQNDYSMSQQNLCTRDNTLSPEVVYAINADAGIPLTFTVTPALGWDASIYLTPSCANVETSCVAGHDEALAETLTYTPSQSGVLYLIVDGANGEAGPFTLEWSVGE